MTPPKILPPHYFAISLLTMIGLRFIDTTESLAGNLYLLGLLPLLLGLAATGWGARLFSNAGTNIVPLTKSTVLVTEGAFKLTRNPMYLGMILALVGVALLLNRPSPWLVLVPFILVIRLGFIRREEQLMVETFGDAYQTYRSRVRRWL